MIVFNTFGRIEMHNAEGAILKTVLAQPKRVALLAVLAAEGGVPRSRDSLLGLFWPDSDMERARVNLRQALRFLRRELDPEIVFTCGAGDLRINAAVLTCDTMAFENECRQGRHAQALALYQGDFLAGSCVPETSPDFEDWLERQRHRFRYQAVKAATELSSIHRAAREFELAINWTYFAIALAPDDEELQRALYRLLGDTGNRSGALRAFNEFAASLKLQLGVAPSSATQSLIEDIRREDKVDARVAARDTRKSVAVLMLVNLTGVSSNDVLCYSVTDEIRSLLSNSPDIRVVPISGDYAIKGREPDFDRIRRRLNVAAVLDGAIWKEGDKVRISTHLIDIATGEQRWAATHERDWQDFDAVRGAIARQIVTDVCLNLTGYTRSLNERPTTNVPAYNLYLKGRFFWSQRPRATEKTLQCLEQAIELEPNFALAHAGIADLYNTLGAWEASVLPPMQAFPKARAAAERALELDPHMAEAHTALGYANTHYLWDWHAAEQQFRRAIAIKPQYGHAHHWLSHLLLAWGRVEESLTSSIQALECDPLDVVINVHLAWHYWLARQYEQVLEQCSRTAELDNNEQWVPMFFGYAHIERGDATSAIDAHRLALQRSNGSPVMLGAVGYSYAVGGETRLARGILKRLEELGAYRGMYGYEMGIIYGALLDFDSAFDCLRRAHREHSTWLAYLKVDPRVDRLRGDPRFAKLIDTVALHQQSKPSNACGHPLSPRRGSWA